MFYPGNFDNPAHQINLNISLFFLPPDLLPSNPDKKCLQEFMIGINFDHGWINLDYLSGHITVIIC